MVIIGDMPKACTHPEHSPSAFVRLEPGVYTHTCPECGVSTTLNICDNTNGTYSIAPHVEYPQHVFVARGSNV
jgi:hypothetical protein